jgi:hypothetical protein
LLAAIEGSVPIANNLQEQFSRQDGEGVLGAIATSALSFRSGSTGRLDASGGRQF